MRPAFPSPQWWLLLPLWMAMLLLKNCAVGQNVESMSGVSEIEESQDGILHATAGTNATLQCVGFGQAVYWRKGKHNISTEDEHITIETVFSANVVDDEEVAIAAAVLAAEEAQMQDVTESAAVESTSALGRVVSKLDVRSLRLHDGGHYHCIMVAGDEVADASLLLRVHVAPVLLSVGDSSEGVAGKKVSVSCTFESNPPPTITWLRNKIPLDEDKRFTIVSSNENNLHMSKLVLDNATLKDNGTYQCLAENRVGAAEGMGEPFMMVHAMPTIIWRMARSLGPEDIQLQWEVLDNGALIKDIEIWLSDDGLESSAERWKTLPSTARSAILGDGVVDAVKGGGQTIAVWLKVTTGTGLEVVSQQSNVTMLLKVPEFIPTASFRGSTLKSLTVFWTSPPASLSQYVSHYLLSLTDVRTGATQQVKLTRMDEGVAEHRFTNLNVGTAYNFTVSACLGVYPMAARDCGPPSPPVLGNTLYNSPDMVEDVVVTCRHDNFGGAWVVHVKWKPSEGAQEQGTVNHYKLELTSIAKYIDEEGQQRYEDERREENVSVNFTSYTFTEVSANTHYTVKVFAGIKHMYSRGVTAQCRMPVWLPRQYRLQWWKANPLLPPGITATANSHLDEDGTPRPALLKMPVPSISQRNGTICCYRVVVVKLAPGTGPASLGDPALLPLLTHRTAHLVSGTGAYVAEAYTGPKLKDRYLILGDNKTVGGNWSAGCGLCLKSISTTTSSNVLDYTPAPQPVPPLPPSSSVPTVSVATTAAVIPVSTAAKTPVTNTTTAAATSTANTTTTTAGGSHVETGSSSTTTTLSSLQETVVLPDALPYGARRSVRSPETEHSIVDGQLSSTHNYTGFLLLTVEGNKGPLNRYSEYFNTVQPAMTEPSAPPSSSTTTPTSPGDASTQQALYVAVGVLLILLIFTIGLCALLIFYKRRNKHLEDELVYNESLSGSLGRKIFRSLRKSNTLMSQNSIDVKPINKEDLVKVYLENIKDSEMGFRREHEALPEKFVDRSCRASELEESCSKNRYPDVKAYDQTRVKLATSLLHPSDYINANFVLGYKERKKFICAQGPMDATVDDFWRMIVEQSCGICVMLTTLEENGKLKCVKYWPEAGQPKKFGNITVRLVKEKSYADYIVRTLRAEWLVQQQAVDSNTDLSKAGGVVGGEGSTSTNTSNASNSNHSNTASISEELKYHEVEQYHYLMWKDFVAPEHPVGILAFLRRVNEAYSNDKGPLLVHCSAGVGRTGTLVALDSLVMELDDEQQASVYNLICDLRHQRNFLVQSLKQYVFIHRALMEYAQFGSTEQTPQQLREAYVKHVNQVQQQASHPILFQQFDLLSKVIEERKAFTVATSDENKNRNRYDFVLPYDSNRVILSPIAGKPLNTYINASFVSGFDLDEHFIVTQDPLENTISDFWRMIYEQDVTTIVMLSEMGSGDNLCTRYWPEEDEEVVHETIRLKLISSESYPKFSSRVLELAHIKSGDCRQVTQFQYVGWSGNLGEVPVGTYGIMEVINRVQSHVHANLSASMPTPVLLHCSGGGDRCSVYVTLNNSLRQLRREGRVDVFQIARRIRSLRQFMLQEPTQYEFCCKALVEYIDSKGLDNI